MRVLLAVFLAVVSFASAATDLVVDGVSVAGLDQETVAGVSYAPAEAFAAAVGADLDVEWDKVGLQLGATLLQLRLTGDTERTDEPGSVAVNGELTAGNAAVVAEGQVLLPVKTVAAAFGGYVTVLSGDRDAVEVRFTSAGIASPVRSTAGGSERLLIGVSKPVPYAVRFDEERNTLSITFRRSRLAGPGSEPEGIHFEHVYQVQNGSDSEIWIRLAADTGYSLSRVPQGNGWQLVVELVQTGDAMRAPAGQGSILIAHPQDGSLAELARAVAGGLEEQGISTSLVQGDLRGPAGSADLQLLLRTGADLAVAYLGEAGDTAQLDLALEQAGGNTEQLARLRRELLLGLHGDLSVGESFARVLSQGLGLPEAGRALPLASLLPGSGRAVAVWLTPEQLADESLATRLTGGLLQALEAR